MGAGLTLGGESLAKGKGHGKAKAQAKARHGARAASAAGRRQDDHHLLSEPDPHREEEQAGQLPGLHPRRLPGRPRRSRSRSRPVQHQFSSRGDQTRATRSRSMTMAASSTSPPGTSSSSTTAWPGQLAPSLFAGQGGGPVAGTGHRLGRMPLLLPAVGALSGDRAEEEGLFGLQRPTAATPGGLPRNGPHHLALSRSPSARWGPREPSCRLSGTTASGGPGWSGRGLCRSTHRRRAS